MDRAPDPALDPARPNNNEANATATGACEDATTQPTAAAAAKLDQVRKLQTAFRKSLNRRRTPRHAPLDAPVTVASPDAPTATPTPRAAPRVARPTPCSARIEQLAKPRASRTPPTQPAAAARVRRADGLFPRITRDTAEPRPSPRARPAWM